ncbi:hypothetical protein DN34_3301 [Vibrio cholerae]|nr:hypothetical protein DN34_3301 [Vibrio cholerae]
MRRESRRQLAERATSIVTTNFYVVVTIPPAEIANK